jgi:hypothetical protein
MISPDKDFLFQVLSTNTVDRVPFDMNYMANISTDKSYLNLGREMISLLSAIVA